jgi:hypothetical protein
MCKLHTAEGDLGRAIRMGRQACDVFAAMPDPLRQARSLLALANAYQAAGRADQADRCRDEARTLLHALGLDPGSPDP